MLYDRFTRLLHLLMATGMVAQMALSLVMVHPKPGRQGDLFYALHETWGQALLGLLVVYWIWSLVRGGNHPAALLWPWFSKPRYWAIWADIKEHATQARQFRLPDGTRRVSPLASAVQGLGLFVATLLGLSGLLLLSGIEPDGAMVGWVHAVKEGHEVMGSLMWVYLVVHASMGILHQWAGHGSMRIMVQVWKKSVLPTDPTSSCPISQQA